MPFSKKVRVALVGLLAAGLAEIAWALAPPDKRADEKTVREPTPIKQATVEPAAQAKNVEDMGSLLRARVELAEKAYQATVERLNETMRQGNVLVYAGKPEEAYQWSLRLLEAQRDLGQNEADGIAALKAHVKRTLELEEKVDQLSRDLLPKTALWEAQWYRLDAQLRLAKAKAK
jgi:hypothetical protein